MWFGGHDMFSNDTFYWLDGTPADDPGLQWYREPINSNNDALLGANTGSPPVWSIVDISYTWSGTTPLCEIIT